MKKTAYIFPGQGSRYVGMGKDICERYPEARSVFEKASDAIGIDLKALCFQGPEEKLRLTTYTQPAILTTSLALLSCLDITDKMFFAGHSLGEFTALVAGGALDLDTAVKLVRDRGRFMQEAVPVGVGAMAAVLGMDRDAVEKICSDSAGDEFVAPANYNSPGQIVISGHAEAVKRAASKAEKEGAKRVVMLQVSAPFHSALMKPAAERLAEALEPIEVHELNVPVLSNVEADFYPSRQDVKRLLTQQVDHPVRWDEQMGKMLQEGADSFLELGPGRVLMGLLKKISRETPVKSIGNTDNIKTIAESS